MSCFITNLLDIVWARFYFESIMNRRITFYKWCWLVVLSTGLGVCYADKINISNGGSFSGLIIEDTKKHIVLDLGTGTMNLDRKYIKSISYSSDVERGEIKKQWRKKHFLNKKFVPAGHEDAVAAFRKLLLQRDVAARASRAMLTSKRKENIYLKKVEELKSEIIQTRLRLEKTSKLDVDAYNKLVHKVNTLTTETSLMVDQVEEFSADSSLQTSVISSYLTKLLGFEELVRMRRNALTADADSDVLSFYDGLLGRLAEFDGEFAKNRIKSRQRGGSTLVTVVMNGKVSGEFVLDTGAELVAMSEEFAVRLGFGSSVLPIVEMTVADGRKVNARAVLLKSVKLGDAYSENVPAVIMPRETSSGYDGLLGMSFLRDYLVQLDGANGNLILRRLKVGK